MTEREKRKEKMKRNDKRHGKAAARCSTFTVKAEAELMAFLAEAMPGASRTKLKSLLSHGAVSVDGAITTQYNTRLVTGSSVQINHAHGPEPLRHPLLKVVYEDEHLIVVHKGAGLLSVNTEQKKENTAYTLLTDYVKKADRRARIFIVHRLDRDTSGLMMFAKDAETSDLLRSDWHHIVYDRRYVAVVVGQMERDEGTVRSWLTDRKLYVHSSPTDDGGQEAITHYRTVKRSETMSLVELRLETGRRNQIRVHMQDIGHPVVGDGRYGIDDRNPLHRLGLHAFKLCFTHPITGEDLEFETPYPIAFKRLFK